MPFSEVCGVPVCLEPERKFESATAGLNFIPRRLIQDCDEAAVEPLNEIGRNFFRRFSEVSDDAAFRMLVKPCADLMLFDGLW